MPAGILYRKNHVAGHGEHHAAAHGEAINGSNDRRVYEAEGPRVP